MKLVIDTNLLGYYWRRFWHALCGYPVIAGTCARCGVGLNANEWHYYEVHCELCAPLFMWDGQ